jgi:PAS domain S-box-containing protein
MVESAVESHAEIVVDSTEKLKIRVLHVDDELALLKVAKQCLELQGLFHVDTADSVEEALNKLKEKDYDVVVSDYQMSGKDGLEFLKQLREKGNDIPFLILTGKSREEVAIRALNLGADGYLDKTGDSGTVYCKLAHAIRQAVDRRSAQIESLRREAKLGAILQASPEAITITDPDGNIIECNQVAVGMHGCQSKKDLVGKNAFGLIAEKDREKAVQNLKKTLEQGSTKNVEYTFLTKDGREFSAELSASVVRDASGKPEYFVAITRDITERKESEEALRETKDYLDNLLNYANAPVIVWDNEQKISLFNNAFEALTGYKKGSMLGRSIDVLFPPLQKTEILQTIERAMAGEKWQSVEVPILCKDGETRIALWNSANVQDKAGNIVATIAQGQDITERKESEEALRETKDYLDNLLNYANAPVIVWDNEQKISLFNNAFEALTGYKKGSMLGRSIDVLFPPLQKTEILQTIERAMAGEKWQSVEVPILCKDGETRIALWNSANVQDKAGNIVATIAQGQDITERKRLQEALLKSERLAAIGQLASAVGHEIRNPLGVIKNSAYFLNMMLKDVADEKVVKHLKILEKEVNSANLIISDLLDFARKKPLTLVKTDLNETVKNTLSKITVPENIKVEIKLGEISKMLLDEERVQRVCHNLILNAVQAMPEGGKLAIQTTKQDDSAKLIVQDTGVGIPKEIVPRLFTPLFSTKAKGIGLGLVICKQIVEGHDGNITVDSRVGEGSTFTVKLPIRTEKKNSEPSAFTVPMPTEERVKIEE